MQSLGKIVKRVPAVGAKMWFFTGRMPRGGKLLVLDLLTGQKSGFSPRRGNSVHRFTSNLAVPTGTWVHLAVQNFTVCVCFFSCFFLPFGCAKFHLNRHRGGNAAPKKKKFH